MESSNESTEPNTDTCLFHQYAAVIMSMYAARSQRIQSALQHSRVVNPLLEACGQPDSPVTAQLLTDTKKRLFEYQGQFLQDASCILNDALTVTQRRYSEGWPGDLHARIAGHPLKTLFDLDTKAARGERLTLTDLQALCAVVEIANSTRATATEIAEALRHRRSVVQRLTPRLSKLDAQVSQATTALAVLSAQVQEPWQERQGIEQLFAESVVRRKILDFLTTTARPGTTDWTTFDQQSEKLATMLKNGFSLCKKVLIAAHDDLAGIDRVKKEAIQLSFYAKRLLNQMELADDRPCVLYWLRKLEAVTRQFVLFVQQDKQWPSVYAVQQTHQHLLEMYQHIDQAAQVNEKDRPESVDRLSGRIVFLRQHIGYFFGRY